MRNRQHFKGEGEGGKGGKHIQNIPPPSIQLPSQSKVSHIFKMVDFRSLLFLPYFPFPRTLKTTPSVGIEKNSFYLDPLHIDRKTLLGMPPTPFWCPV